MKYKVPISVVMPCYNGEAYISQAIQSILEQSYKSFELIIINDASTDNSELEIKQFKDSRIKYIKNFENKGNSIARNLGMSSAIGKYICIMDFDTIARVDRLELQFSYLETHPSVGCIGGSVEIINEDNRFLRRVEGPLSYPIIKIWLLKNNCVFNPTIMIRSHLVKKYQLFYNERYRYASDYDFIVRASRVFPVRNLNKVLIQCRSNPDKVSFAKRMEQNTFIRKIRKQQLKSLRINYTSKEIALHQKMMEREYINDADRKMCEDWLNKLCNANYKRRLFNIKHFPDLSQNLLTTIVNNPLGGWSIEKELLNYIRNILSNGKSILEFGSGKGTDALLEFYKVTSIEHNTRFSFKRKENHHCIFVPIQDGWYQHDCVEAALEKPYDLIIVDGPPGLLRKGILKNLNLFKKIRTPVIFDDVNRELDKEIMSVFCNELKYNHKIINGEKKAFAFCSKINQAIDCIK